MSDTGNAIFIWTLPRKSTVSANPCSCCDKVYHCKRTWLACQIGNLYKLAPKKECYIVYSCPTPHFTTFSHFWTCLLTILRLSSIKKKKNTPAGEQFIFLCCPNDRTFSSRSRACQTTDVNTLHFCMSAECKLSPFHCICPNMLPYSVASCREAFLRSLGHLATSQAKCSSTPKMSSSLSLKAIFLTAVAFMFSTHNWCSCWKEKVGNFFSQSLILIVQFYCWFKPAAVLSEVQEFQPSPTLFSKSYYPRWSPAASGILYKLCQLTSVLSPLHEEFSTLQRSGQFFLISSQKIRT